MLQREDILAFGIRRGNEDFVSWDIFNTLFAQACSCVWIVEEGHKYSKYVFVSDQDKGLDKSLTITFPNNLATNCVHHKKENLRTRFGPKAAEMVFPIARAFSTVVEETYWMKL